MMDNCRQLSDIDHQLANRTMELGFLQHKLHCSQNSAVCCVNNLRSIGTEITPFYADIGQLLKTSLRCKRVPVFMVSLSV